MSVCHGHGRNHTVVQKLILLWWHLLLILAITTDYWQADDRFPSRFCFCKGSTKLLPLASEFLVTLGANRQLVVIGVWEVCVFRYSRLCDWAMHRLTAVWNDALFPGNFSCRFTWTVSAIFIVVRLLSSWPGVACLTNAGLICNCGHFSLHCPERRSLEAFAMKPPRVVLFATLYTWAAWSDM